MARRKTPREKKELDYDRQRRTHWDSQKAARTAIPAAKQAARQIIRKRSAEMLATPDQDWAPTAAELQEIEKRNRYRKYNPCPETLRVHVAHQQKDREEPKQLPSVSRPTGYSLLSDAQRLSAYLQRTYTAAGDDQFMDFLRKFELLTRGYGGEWTRKVAEVLNRERNGRFITAFLSDNPRWARRIDAITKRGLPHKGE